MRPVIVDSSEKSISMQSFGKMGLGPRGGMPARPWGQRIGSNDKHNEWKLFIGQVPLEVSLRPSYLNLLQWCAPEWSSFCGQALL